MELTLNMYQTAALAVPVYYIGKAIKDRVLFLQKYCIPSPVVGGVLAALLFLLLRMTGLLYVEMDTTLQTVFMLVFFCTVGYSARLNMLLKGGMMLVLMVIASAVLCVMQDGLGAAIVTAFGEHPLLGTALGSVSLVGGHGTAAAFGPEIEALGVQGAEVASYAAATFGVVTGCIVGGPLARARIMRLKNPPTAHIGKHVHVEEQTEEKADTPLDQNRLMLAVALLLVSVGLGTVITFCLEQLMTFSAAVGSLLGGCLFRLVCDVKKIKLPDKEIGMCGNIALYIFLSMAMMSMELWELAELALPMVITLLAQVLAMALFCYFVIFNIMGRNYEAAVMVSGVCGYGLGSTSNAIANMEAITSVYGPAPQAFLVIPIVGSLLADLVNSGVITLFMNVFA